MGGFHRVGHGEDSRLRDDVVSLETAGALFFSSLLGYPPRGTNPHATSLSAVGSGCSGARAREPPSPVNRD